MSEFNPVALEIARESRELTQKELSEKLGITQSYMSQLEKGDSKPSKEFLSKLAIALEYPETFFFSDIEWTPPITPFGRSAKHRKYGGYYP